MLRNSCYYYDSNSKTLIINFCKIPLSCINSILIVQDGKCNYSVSVITMKPIAYKAFHVHLTAIN